MNIPGAQTDSALPSIQPLLRSPEIQLMSFQRSEAYAAHYHYLSLVTLLSGALDFAASCWDVA
jgi:hypothetical protein